MSHTLALFLIGVVVLCSTPPPVSGRDSRLFSKLTRRVAVVSPAAAQAEQGFGLYGSVDDSQADLPDNQQRYETRYDRDSTTSGRAEPINTNDDDHYSYNNDDNNNNQYNYDVDNNNMEEESPERYEFESMEEYEKYQESRRSSTNYDP